MAEFTDRYEVSIENELQEFDVDNLFVEACEPDSIVVTSIHSDEKPIGNVLAKITNNIIVVKSDEKMIPYKLRISVAGVRKGMTERFKVYNEYQARRNAAFWDSSINGVR